MRSVMIKEWQRTCPTTAQRLLHSPTEIGSARFTEPVMRKESSPPLPTVIRKEWPPLRTCPQYECRLISGFVDRKYPWEDEGKERQYFKLYKPPGSVDVEMMRRKLLKAKKFLHQVRTTRCYGVTFHQWCGLTPVEFSEWYPFTEVSMELALTHISKKTGQAYELVKIENVVHAALKGLMFLTFDAKMRDSVPETFLSMVSYRNGNKGVMECLLKPDCEADWGANEDKLLCLHGAEWM